MKLNYLASLMRFAVTALAIFICVRYFPESLEESDSDMCGCFFINFIMLIFDGVSLGIVDVTGGKPFVLSVVDLLIGWCLVVVLLCFGHSISAVLALGGSIACTLLEFDYRPYRTDDDEATEAKGTNN